MVQAVEDIENPSGFSVLRVFISLIIMIFNLVLSLVFDILGKYECHSSYTSMKNSIINKSFIFTTTNTVFTFLFIFTSDWINGMLYDKDPKTPRSIANWLLTEAILTPILLIFDPKYIYRLYRRYKIKSNKINIEQKEANKIYTNPFFSIERRSIQYIRIFTVVLLFSFIFPAGLIVSILPIVTCFITDKYLLLRRYSRSNKYGKKLSLQVVSKVSSIVPIYIVRFI